ncbi:unnamed protein product [Brassicogethes aeneus]|uniref:non-specific serine/threonine protein kinase n=1 Tax=Brassicogethes aeneus TaxID=1431903 RepID=A0A9P0AQ51_BRAAE|nr:unnamed protein product [Brassicogethes aeneus]
MISNSSSSYKHKASKNHDFDYDHSDENYDNNSVDDEAVESNHKYNVYSRDGRYRGGIGRAKSTEFRSSNRLHDRRGGYRGRGGSSRRGDRDYSDNLYSTRKYDLRNSDSGGNYRGKFYEPEKKVDFKYSLPEDTRISKLLRRLSSEVDQDNSLAISKKLLEVLLIPDNAIYVRKAFHILGESMYDIVHVSPGPLAKQQAARALGRMGYIMGQENDFERYQHWLFSKMVSSHEEIQILLMKSFKETFSMEAKKPVLENHADNLINSLVATIETTENTEIFKAILDTLMSFVELYPRNFYDQFRDTIDLLFGWHVDHTQSLSNIEFISRNLLRTSHHFKYNLDFSVSLIENFLEDIANYSTQIEHVTVLILALNTILKCLDTDFYPVNNKFGSVEFVNKCLWKIANVFHDFLKEGVQDNLIIAANECISLLLAAIENKSQKLTTKIFELTDDELALIDDFSDASIVSLLLFISKTVKELSTNLPIELIEKLIGPESKVLYLRHSPVKNIQNAVICVYQSLLNVKNVSLLQEAYRYVLGDLEVAFRQIVPNLEFLTQNNPFSERKINKSENFELTVLFLLRCLSQLANASSIIVMWALKPTILELVGVNLQPYNPLLAKNTPSLQYSLLYLLYSHCKCYNHFISNSSLVTNKKELPNMMKLFTISDGLNMNDVPNTSPNSGNFAIILNILYKTLNTTTSCEVKLLLLQWMNDILINSENYLENLYDNEQFQQITNILVKCGYKFHPKIAEMVCENLDKLLSNKQLSWTNIFLSNVCDLCKLHLNSNHQELRQCYGNLVSNIPWDIAIVELNKKNTGYTKKIRRMQSKDYNNYMLYMAQHLHLNGNIEGEIYSLQFKAFMDYLLNNEDYPHHWLQELFACCWTYEGQMNMELFYELAINSRQVLSNWVTLEAAQFCVNYKLRTPLGKPNETFTKIEGALNQLGNDLIALKKTGKSDTANTDADRVKMLLQFVEHLEKSIYNASEGTALAMPQPTKVVKSFFIANTNTCNEWLSRIRMVVIHIALHSGESNIALRHGQSLLRDFVNSGKSNSPEFEKVLIFVTIAFLNLKETEALYGVYAWCKNMFAKRLTWIKLAAEQASKKYEIALEGYLKLLEENQNPDEKNKPDCLPLEPDTLNFIQDQIVVCYKELNNWADLVKWHEQDKQENIENGRKYWFNSTDWDCNKSLANLDISNHAFKSLSTWEYKEENKSWSVYETLSAVETNLFNVAVNITSKTVEDSTTKLNTNISTIQRSIQEHLNSAPTEFLQNFSLLLYVANGLKNVANNSPAHTVFLVSENFENEIEKVDSSVLRKILWWSEYFGAVQNQGFNIFCSNLRLDIIKRARKEKNHKLAHLHLTKFFRDKDVQLENFEYGSIANTFIEKVGDIQIWSVDVAKAASEIIKLSYIQEENRNHTFNLCAATSTAISKYAELFGGMELRKISSKILIKLAAWLQINENISLTEMNSPLGKLIMVLPEIGMMENIAANIIPLNEMAIGKLLQFSVHHCTTLAKSWNAFGTWCYRWGKKIVDHSSDIKNNLTDEQCLEIKKLLPSDATEEDCEKIMLIISQTRSIIDEEDIDSNEINTSEMIQGQLQCVDVLKYANDDVLHGLVQIWRNTQKRIYAYYFLSADAYFKYLHLASNLENITKSTECYTITVTLRLLRLIVKYALELQNILEEGLQTTPTQPWKVIIPQLFSRLNHPEGYVRHRVSDLLCRVAEDAPQLITFPAVVGALEGGLKFEFSEITLPKDCLSQNNDRIEDNELNEDDDYDSDNEESTNTLQTCFKTMVDTLSKQDSETITQVQTLVKELRRITLLWDELWLGTLAQHQTEISKRQQQLEFEIEKVNENTNLNSEEKISLIAEKHRIIIKPIIFILEQLLDVTSVDAETPHEKEFQEKYMDDIKSVIAKLKNPETPEKPQESLLPLKTLQKKFQQKFHKRASYSLKMQDISPILHGIKDTVIAMPGIATTAKNITIAYVSNVVSILPTKTKPKKLIFYGSDGQTYTYLFKGLEDLHLDERIMQFLSIANTMMAQNTDPTGHNLYRARHYSVIPLGPRSGLISWVDGTTPAFALYKRWQQREIAKPSTKNAVNTTTSVLRPSELFYNKLNPLLQEHGVKNPENRKEWPLAVLKQVLTELMSETPSDLLSKELWCNSISAGAWWQIVKRYSYSVAVMSIIGYIIGLGDRHLDNMLVDLNTGDVVHIDYNVCFEKGKTLRVPEKVPFRLTPNIKEALGATGVEGIFRLACENVLKTMKKGRETLLTLLEAFVYDPLIDWTVGGEVLAGTTFGGVATTGTSRQSKKDLEREVTLSMFNVRCTEMRAEWNENKDEVLSELPKLEASLNHWLSIEKVIAKSDDLLQDLHQQLALVKEAEAHGANKHPLYKLPMKYAAYHKSQSAMNLAKKDLETIITDYQRHLLVYDEALKSFEKGTSNALLINISSNGCDTNIFDLVREFLHNAGKDDVILQCQQSETEMDELCQNINIFSKKCLQHLQNYYSILSTSPKSYLDNHRLKLFVQWASLLLEKRNIESCEYVFENFNVLLENNLSTNVFKFAIGLDSLYQETVGHVNKLFEELTKLSTKEPTIVLEKLYSNAKLSISSFLASEKGAASAFEFVIASELVLLNRNFITLEIAAHRSDKVLIKLQTREGDWFLDDLVMNSMRAVEMVNTLLLRQTTDDRKMLRVLSGVKIANNIYQGLFDLQSNFHTIILPESMKKIQSEEPTVLQMINDLNELISSLDLSIPELIEQLGKILQSILMQMDVNKSYDYILEMVLNIRLKFQTLIGLQTENLSQGKMLLMGFNGLFEKLSQEMNNLVSTLSDLETPKSWKKIDQVKEAKSISAHIFNPDVRKILDDIFLLKRIQTISDFLRICQDMCQSFKKNANLVIYNDEQLAKPVRQFIADFISSQLLGITTETIAYTVCCILQNLGIDLTLEIEQRDIGAEHKVPLDEICHKAWNVCLKKGIFTHNVWSQAQSLENNLKNAWEKIKNPKKLEQKLAQLQSTAIRLQNQLMVHNFMYDVHGINSVRNKLLADCHKELLALQTVLTKLAEAREKQQILIDNAYQRLNWAKGANPNVGEISKAFENAVQLRDNQLNIEQKAAANILSIGNSILQYEILRNNNVESNAYNNAFSDSFENWRTACQYGNERIESMSHTEECIMNLLSTELLNDPKWLNVISDQITKKISFEQKKLTEAKTFIVSERLNLQSIIENLKLIYGVQGRLMSDVKNLIKAMTKIEDYSVQTHYFIEEYRQYIEHFNLLFAAFKKDVRMEEINDAIKHVEFIKTHTEHVYDMLFDLEVKKGRTSLVRRDCLLNLKMPLKQDSTTKGQQRNAYAVGVDYVIKEATSLENLALLYEGWTPWV